jgi:16S rRNA (cytosine967-C5)-methyltransferase
VCLRARGEREALRAVLASKGVEAVPTRLAKKGLIVITPRPNLLGLGLQGQFEVQDEGSQLLGELVDARAGEEVLDLCAGAGGKTLQLAGDGARVHATDIDLERLERLRTRASKANVPVLIHGKAPPVNLRVDRVLVDAPCSELGVLRRGPDLRWRIEPGIVDTMPAVQRELVEKGLAQLKPGGTLVYATCTITRAENEAVVESVLATHPELERARGDLQVDPFHHGTDGFFAAVLRRKAG